MKTITINNFEEIKLKKNMRKFSNGLADFKLFLIN